MRFILSPVCFFDGVWKQAMQNQTNEHGRICFFVAVTQ